MKHFYLSFIVLLVSVNLVGQSTGGQYLFSVLELPTSARTTAYGSQQIAYTEADIQMIGNNPALLSADLHQHINFSTLFLPAGINANNLSYAHKFNRFTSALQLQFINYGSFKRTDVEGNEQGEFYGNDFVFSYASSFKKENWTFGAATKFIHSTLESYKATGLALDAGATWFNEEANVSFSAVIKNLGTVMSSYTGTEDVEDLPFDVQLAFSKRLKYVPFRFSVNAHDLHRWDIRYDDPNETQQTSLFGEEQKEKSNFSDELFRHFIFAGEMYLGKPLAIQVAYNHQRRQEMSLDNKAGLVGFSFGLAIKTKKFNFNYGIGVNSLAGSAHHLSFSTSINNWKTKKKRTATSKKKVGE